MKDTEFERQTAYGEYRKEVRELIGMDPLPPQIEDRMLFDFMAKVTPQQAIDRYNKWKESIKI